MTSTEIASGAATANVPSSACTTSGLVAIANAVDLSTSNVLIFIETAGFNATLELDLKAIADEATSATITRTRA